MKGIEYSLKNNYKPTYLEATKKDKVYFKIAESIAELSKDENTKVGSVIIDKEGKVVSLGYNGCTSKFGLCFDKDDTHIPHSREERKLVLKGNYYPLIKKHSFITNKYPFMIHAEQNALLTASDMNRLKDATIYVTHYPCPACADMIAQVGIKNVKLLDNRHGKFEETIMPTLYVYENKGMTFTIYGNV
jgi:dCMP deaminase